METPLLTPMLTIVEVAELLNVCELTVRRWWYAGDIPEPKRIGRRSIRWRRDDIETFMNGNPLVDAERHS